MGIKNLKKFIRERYPNEIQKMNIADFYGKVFMMDIMSYIYKYKISMREKWLQSIIHLIKLFKYNNVHVNIVFEGESPVEKNKEKEQRRNQRKQQEQRIIDLKKDMEDYYETGIMSDLIKDVYTKLNVSNTDKINSLLHFSGNIQMNIPKKEITTLNPKMIEQLQDYIDKKENQLVIVTQQDTDKIKDICDAFGVPYFQSESEAETLCCKMCSSVKMNKSDKQYSTKFNKKLPIGVISEDSDVLAYGADMLLCDLNISNGECTVIYLPSVLQTMNLSYQQFLEFCVMCGTDYNKNIPGIGSVKCLELLNKHKSLDTIYQTEQILIKKKIDDAIKKKKMKLQLNGKNLNINSENGENENEEKEEKEEDEVDINTTPEKLYKEMKRSIEMFNIETFIINKSDYWNSNIQMTPVSECCLIYNVDYDNILKTWSNKIKLVK